MGSKNLETNDLVWAKMKGYPHWPGKITSPDAKSKPKKNHHYVYFFGSNNCAWIADEFIELHSEKMIEKYGQRKGELFRKAVQTITEQGKAAPKHHTLAGSVDSAPKTGHGEKKSDKVSNSELQSKNKSLLGNSSLQKIKKKLSIKKITPVKTLSPEIKLTKKRSLSPNQNEPKRHVTSAISGMYSSEKSISTEDFLNVFGGSKKTSSQHPDSLLSDSTSTSEAFQKKKYFQCHDSSPIDSTYTSETFQKKKYIQRPDTPPIDLTYKSEAFLKKKIGPTNKTIGFLGLNNIGQGIIKNLCHSGHSLIIWNKTEEECKTFAEKFKIKIAATPAEVMKAADLVFSCMSDPEASKDIIEGDSGILEGLEQSRENKSYIEMTSMDPKMSQIIETDIKGKGGRYLEAPFCGSRIEANEGTLLIVAAGDKTVYDDCRSCFDAMSKKHMFISAEVGSASKLNVFHNMLIGTVYASLAEALSLIDQVGLKGEDFCDILKVGALSNNNMLQKLTSMVKKNYVANTPLKQMQQNFNVGLSIGHEMSQRSKLFSSANEVYKRCKLMKYDNHDVSAVFEGTRT